MSDICCDILRFYCKITIFSNNVICVIKCLQSITSFVRLFLSTGYHSKPDKKLYRSNTVFFTVIIYITLVSVFRFDQNILLLDRAGSRLYHKQYKIYKKCCFT